MYFLCRIFLKVLNVHWSSCKLQCNKQREPEDVRDQASSKEADAYDHLRCRFYIKASYNE
jgi:hypothetical protein